MPRGHAKMQSVQALQALSGWFHPVWCDTCEHQSQAPASSQQGGEDGGSPFGACVCKGGSELLGTSPVCSAWFALPAGVLPVPFSLGVI